MAFIAEYSNGVCLSGYLHINRTMLTNKQFVAGVTGLYTLSAISLGKMVSTLLHVFNYRSNSYSY